MKGTIRFVRTIFFWMILHGAQGQQFSFGYESSAWSATDVRLPFWLQANQFGAVPENSASISISPSLRYKNDTSARWSHQIAFRPFVAVGSRSRFQLIEGWASMQRKYIRVWAGRKPQVMGLVDSLHSSGSITWSGNSLAIPQIALDMPDYYPIWHGKLAVKASFSHGWFGEQTYAERYFLHQKSIYFRLGNPSGRWRLYGGLLHHAQWGGNPTTATRPDDVRLFNGKFPGDAYTYSRVVLPLKSLVNTRPGYNPFELENRFGSHLGQVDLGAELSGEKGKALFYKQILFETGATFSSLSNIDDGLYGVVWQSKQPESPWKRITIEYLQTTNQGTYQPFLPRLLGLQDRHFGENNFYFNHQQYFDGWSYERRTLGTPFLIPEEKIRSNKASNNGFIFTNNNRVRMIYLGMIHQFSIVEVRSRLSFSRNFGSHWIPIPPSDQVSFGIETRMPMGKSFLKAHFGLDRGDLIKDNVGFRVGMEKIW